MRKRVIALLCTMALAISVVACGAKEEAAAPEATPSASEEVAEETPAEPKDPVELVYWYNNVAGPQEYTQQVEDKLNDILKNTEGYEHITLKLKPCKDYATDIALAQASGEQMDIISNPGLNVVSEIQNGAWLALDDLVAANPEITAELPEWFVEYGKVDGTLWCIPNYQQCANQWFWYTPKEFLDNSGYTAEQVEEILLAKDVDKLAEFYENYINAIREYKDSDEVFLDSDKLSNLRYWIQPSNNIHQVDWNGVFYWDEEAEEITFSDLNENLQAAYLKNGEFYASGILYKDADTDTEYFSKTMVDLPTSVFENLQSYGTNEMVSTMFSNNIGCEIVAFNTHDYIFMSNTNAAGGVAISSTTEHPEDAAKVLALLFNSKYAEFYNTLVYGLEDVHYEWVDKEAGIIKTKEYDIANAQAGVSYGYQKWRGGNTFNAWLNQATTPEQKEYIINEINENDSNVITPLMGFVLDTKVVESELAQIKAVVTEYSAPLRSGVKGADTQAYLDDYLAKLEAAGLSKVLDEFNAQANEFLGK